MMKKKMKMKKILCSDSNSKKHWNWKKFLSVILWEIEVVVVVVVVVTQNCSIGLSSEGARDVEFVDSAPKCEPTTRDRASTTDQKRWKKRVLLRDSAANNLAIIR